MSPASRSAMDGYPVPPPTMTDLYELTMAAGYWKLGRLDDQAIFTLFFRHAPFGGGFTLAAGLEGVVAFIEHYRFSAPELEHLAGLVGNDDRPLFEPAFLDYLARPAADGRPRRHARGHARVPARAARSGSPGSLLQGQLLESALLNLVNYPTLAATKAAHVVFAAGGAPVMEFGLRRAQGPDGGARPRRGPPTSAAARRPRTCSPAACSASRSAAPTPTRWILSFADEQTAFDAWAEVMPGNAVLLVDTYDTRGGHRERHRDRPPDARARASSSPASGSTRATSRTSRSRAREMLDAAGLSDTQVVASNDLDPATIESLQAQGARIDSWGVGTKLVTCYDQPALGGVYKLGRDPRAGEPAGSWRTPVKVSADTAKITVPGMLAVRRFYDGDGTARADMIWDELARTDGSRVIVDPVDSHHRLTVDAAWTSRELAGARVPRRRARLRPAVASATRATMPATSWARSTRRSSASSGPTGTRPASSGGCTSAARR